MLKSQTLSTKLQLISWTTRWEWVKALITYICLI